MFAFGVDLQGRVRNLHVPTTKPLVPLFEAVVNSIQAIQAAEVKKGEVRIEIVRDESQRTLVDDANVRDVIGFRVIDNGVGFTAANYDAFMTSDTTNKARIGGKGVGRFAWLKAFDRIEVESVYLEDGEWWMRSFTFSLKESGISDERHERATGEGRRQRRTTVRSAVLQLFSRYARRRGLKASYTANSVSALHA